MAGPGTTTLPNFYPRSPCGERQYQQFCVYCRQNFYPRSPCGERPYDGLIASANFCNFYPRSPCGERQHLLQQTNGTPKFLSTLSLRRATSRAANCQHRSHISIHALLAESDYRCWCARYSRYYFYPRSPCGERHSLYPTNVQVSQISIHALLAESDRVACFSSKIAAIFLSTLSLRRATSTAEPRMVAA